jgi:hypothetical protein
MVLILGSIIVNCITVNGKNEYDFRGMDIGTAYYFCIQALNENGVSERTNVLLVE